jgi:nitrilase
MVERDFFCANPDCRAQSKVGDVRTTKSAAAHTPMPTAGLESSCSLETEIEDVSQGDSELRRIQTSAPLPISMILGLEGDQIAEPVIGHEGVVIAEIDISRSIGQKQFHDIIGSYNRFDIFRLGMDQQSYHANP